MKLLLALLLAVTGFAADVAKPHVPLAQQPLRMAKDIAAFEAMLERNLFQLHEELVAGAYTPSRSICFVVTRPRPREVWAAQFRDRIVHHLLYNHIAPRFHAAFTADSCACIPGRGTLYAAQRLEAAGAQVGGGVVRLVRAVAGLLPGQAQVHWPWSDELAVCQRP